MDELAKLLSYKINQLANHSNPEEAMRSEHLRTLTAQEVKKNQTKNTAFINSGRNDLYEWCEDLFVVMFFVKPLNRPQV